MKRIKPITLPELVKLLGHSRIIEAIDCNRQLPLRWERGARPGWRNAEKLVAFAKEKGFDLRLYGGRS